MSEPEWLNTPAALLRMLQIAVAAMVAGCLIFLVIAMFVARGREAAAPPVVTYVGFGVAVGGLLVRSVVVRIIVARGRRKILRETPGDEQLEKRISKVAQLLFTRTLAAAAFVESLCFFLLVAYLVEAAPWSLVAAGALILFLALHCPTQTAASAWIADQMRLLQEEQMFER